MSSTNTTGEHSISAKLPIQPSFVPSIGCFSSFNNTQNMGASSSKISLGGLDNNKSREQLGGMGNMNLSATGPLN